MNVNEATIEAIRECNTKCFYMNRLYDTAMDTLAIDFVCSQAEGLMHEHMAHFWTAIADELNHKCLGAFNIKTYYGATPAGDWEWENLDGLMGQLMAETIQAQTMFMGAVSVAIENGDYQIVAELYDILKKVNAQVEQIILIKDKAELYKNDYATFDNHFADFFFLDN